MHVITDPRCAAYQRAGHPERPARIEDTVARLRGQQALPVQWPQPLEVSDAQLERAHDASWIRTLRESRDDFDDDTPWHPGIDQHALRSVGGALRSLNLAREGVASFSLLRQPGHHATRRGAMGFCYLNSIAIAALEALATGASRVAVFDFDVHHGNGTEDILLGRRGAAFFSVHQSPCYPGTGLDDVGDNCFNYPVRPGIVRKEYLGVLETALADLRRFKPDVVGVSAGFDGYVRDPLAQGSLEAEDYHGLGVEFRRLGVPVFSVLEGGYSSELPELVLAYLTGLEGLGG
ncbi:MAG: histone deacetylase [Verrucomicrobia bacterium]|nr:histone deacetylase [Verrucomicrobiota bacterium]